VTGRWDGEGPLFRDRVQAGQALASAMRQYRGQGVVVLGIPRGGVPVATEVARALGGELDIIVARKLGSPVSEELAIGAVTADGGVFWNDEVLAQLRVPAGYQERVKAEQMAEARRREDRFRGGRPAPSLAGRLVIVVDDGLATGSTMIAALRAVRSKQPARLIAAVPVGSRQAVDALRREADEVVCLHQPEPFGAIGFFYEHFEPTEDRDVEALLRGEAPARAAPASG